MESITAPPDKTPPPKAAGYTVAELAAYLNIPRHRARYIVDKLPQEKLARLGEGEKSARWVPLPLLRERMPLAFPEEAAS